MFHRLFRRGVWAAGALVVFILTSQGSAAVITTILPTATTELALPRLGGIDITMGLTFDPIQNKYYSGSGNHRTGDAFVWDAGGTLLQRIQPINADIRALNYNPLTN